MSLRSYLFALIGCLIILLTLTQLFLVYWIEQNLTREVDVQARNLSEQVFELAFEELNNVEEHKGAVKYISENISVDGITVITEDRDGNRQVSFKKHLTAEEMSDLDTLVTDKQLVEKGDENTEKELHVVKKEFKTIIDRIYQKKHLVEDEHLASEQNIIVFPSKTVNHQWIKGLAPESKTKQLLVNIQWVLILCCIVALIAAYWLSAQFNKPLAMLSAGFKRLANGDYQHQVTEQGIQEMRKTIQHFNEMVKRLDLLTQAEQQHNEIKHLAELGEVSRGLAHSLRNPIHTIGLSIEQLNDDSLTKEYRAKLISTIGHKIIHIDKNIKALLTLTTGGLNREESVPVLAVVQDIILEYKSCHGKPQKFAVNIPSDLTIIGAESEIRSILHTMIINACESNSDTKNKESDENKIVSITAKNSGDYLTIQVIDQGLGLDRKIEKSLFKPHISTKPEGAGMGLYIAKRIISLHYNGNISLKNKCEDNSKVSGCIAKADFKNGNITQQETNREAS